MNAEKHKKYEQAAKFAIEHRRVKLAAQKKFPEVK